MDEAPVKPGEVLGQKFRVDRVLGVGGMGVVVAATHLQLDQRVALKFMLPDAFKNADALQRFQREARAAVRLKSEHVARVLDTGTFENSSPYIVMEFLEGSDLSEELRRNGPLPLFIVAEHIIQACDALAEAHSAGIVHRDLKPANLFLTRRHDGSPLVKVLDFGISKVNALNEGDGLAMTSTAAMMGSPLYMSPEQMRASKHADARSDVWSVGVILYELLSGSVPFMAETLGELMSRVMMDAVKPLSAVRPDIPKEVSDLVDRCLEKDRERRAQNVAEIAVVLGRFAPPRCNAIVERVSNVLGRPEPPRSSGASPVATTHLLPSGSHPTPSSAATPAASPPQMIVTPLPIASPASAPALGASTSRAWGGTTPGPSNPVRNAIPFLAAGVLLVAAGLGGAYLKLRSPASAINAATPSASEPTPVSASASPSPPASAAEPAPSSTTAVPASALAPSATPSVSPMTSSQTIAVRPALAPASKGSPPRPTSAPAHPQSAPSPAPAPSPTQASAAPPSTGNAPKKPGILDTSN